MIIVMECWRFGLNSGEDDYQVGITNSVGDFLTMLEELEKSIDTNMGPVVRAIKADIEDLWINERKFWSQVVSAASADIVSVAVAAVVVTVSAIAGVVIGSLGAAFFVHELFPEVPTGAVLIGAGCLLGLVSFVAHSSARTRLRELSALFRETSKLH
jgi:hypothetical protein